MTNLKMAWRLLCNPEVVISEITLPLLDARSIRVVPLEAGAAYCYEGGRVTRVMEPEEVRAIAATGEQDLFTAIADRHLGRRDVERTIATDGAKDRA